ncbi:MAG: phosphomannomutase [candidate division WS1 bacterium]|jgi:phosphomannomutase|nr:phosphomannomutase [candidate division WS1 bacterium]
MGGQSTAAFGSYDVRGRIPDELNADIVYDIGRAYVQLVRPDAPVAVGRDMRLSSEELADALIRGLNDAGADAVDIGMVGTEVIYFASAQQGVGGGIMVTASHNPSDYNGLKFVRSGARPISGDTGLREMEAMVAEGNLQNAAQKGQTRRENVDEAYVSSVLSFIDPQELEAMDVVVNPGNGCAGPFLDMIAGHLPISFTRMDYEPDGTFPHGVPNPLKPENRLRTAEMVKSSGAALGIAWDGDFDRCFFFDENAQFIEGYYLVGLLAQRMLKNAPGAKIIHDPRLVWNTVEVVTQAGGVPVQSKTGHAFIKERMRAEDAVYGGEMSAHHYFRDFNYADSGMIPWLLVVDILSRRGEPMSSLVAEREERFPCSGEINVDVADASAQQATIERVREVYQSMGGELDLTDGISLAFDNWRFNLRTSNTEPVIRLNVETRGDRALLEEKTEELLQQIRG